MASTGPAAARLPVRDPITLLSLVVALLAVSAAVTGLLWGSRADPQPFITARGTPVQLNGDGLYRYDAVAAAAGQVAVDIVVLLVGVPLLLVALRGYRRGSPRGVLLLAATMGYLLYVYANGALGVAYNSLFLVYVALLSVSLFGFCTAVVGADRAPLVAAIASGRVPVRALAAFLFTSGTVTALLWLAPLVAGLLYGAPPAMLGNATTMVTYALDLAVIAPAAGFTGYLLMCGRPLGLLLAAPLLLLVVALLPTLVLSTVLQVHAGVPFDLAQMAGPVAGFALLGSVGAALLIRLLAGAGPRSTSEAASAQVQAVDPDGPSTPPR
ncbi:hypothetical protein ACVGVM_13670 [Pseudonocardia bannensis]|uniref:Uncharacterized protein n=1 Tax=Pseudonocardia bannensis TaxID=630973 RepID=A0A848DRP8_9PSEU|nr:hypothetical protein [Pseudonocardia bannensis]NMH95537.1 hypothetical protein [Pseudonocardia bannensis]